MVETDADTARDRYLAALEAERAGDKRPEEAILEAARVRFLRPAAPG